MNIQKALSGAALTVALEGRLDTTTAPKLEEELRSSVDGITRLVFDVEKLEYISSAGLRVLLAMQKLMNQQGEMVLQNVNEAVTETLEVTMPCLFTMEKKNYPLRLPSLKNWMASKKAVITTLTSKDIPGLDLDRIGDPGSPTKVPRMFPPVMPEPGVMLDEGSAEATVTKLISLIKD